MNRLLLIILIIAALTALAARWVARVLDRAPVGDDLSSLTDDD